MLASVLETLGGKLTDRWAGVTAPAVLFWFGGLLAYASPRNGGGAWRQLIRWFSAQDTSAQLLLVLVALVVVAVSATVVQWLTLPTLRALEGYWPRLARLQWLLNRRRAARLNREQQRWDELIGKVKQGRATREEQETFALLDARLRRVPADARSRMPTRLGDLLRAAEIWPHDKYGLEAIACFPRMWLVMSQTTRDELGAARARLDAAVGVWLWGLLFVLWTPWAWWAPLIALVVTVATYSGWILGAARSYGDLLEAAFDVHRKALYEALRWPLPGSPAEEQACGRAVTGYLWRGLTPDPPPTYPTPRAKPRS